MTEERKRFLAEALLYDIRGEQDSEAFQRQVITAARRMVSNRDRTPKEKERFPLEQRPMESIFNLLNGNEKKGYYPYARLAEAGHLNFPTEVPADVQVYRSILQDVKEKVESLDGKDLSINALLDWLEEELTYVPAPTAEGEPSDISLFDEWKLTAAYSICIYDYLKEQDEWPNADVFGVEPELYEKKMFLLFSMDFSGIQDFIYTVHSEGALKNLRARSFYLEIMMEHIIDTLLERLELCRINLIYSGGGHCYLLLPNTVKNKEIILALEQELGQWLLEQFDIALYVAFGMTACSASELNNQPQGSYSDIFRKVSNEISGKKAARYSARQILELNHRKISDYTRECKVCKRLGKLNQENLCDTCA